VSKTSRRIVKRTKRSDCVCDALTIVACCGWTSTQPRSINENYDGHRHLVRHDPGHRLGLRDNHRGRRPDSPPRSPPRSAAFATLGHFRTRLAAPLLFAPTIRSSTSAATHFLIALGHRGAAREFDTAFFIDAKAFHPDLVAKFDDVFCLFDAEVSEFADVDEAVFAGQNSTKAPKSLIVTTLPR